MDIKFKMLFQPIKIGKVELANRYAVSPMFMPFYFDNNGEFTDTAVNYFVERAKGGFGLIYTGCLRSDQYQDVDEIPPVPGVYNNPPAFIRSSQTLLERVHTFGSKMFAQLGVSMGRNAVGCRTPSELPYFFDPGLKSKAITKEQIAEKQSRYFQCAKIIKDAGFDGIEVHAMHWGYLLDEFAMSLMNHREDEYGGCLENRLRFAKELVEGIKHECGKDFPVSMRLALKSFIKDFNKGSLDGREEAGRTIEEALQIAKLLESYGYDMLSVDVGSYEAYYYGCPPMYVNKGFYLDLSKRCKEAVNIPVFIGGARVNDPVLAEKALEDGCADGIVLGRQSLADPYYPRKVMMGNPEKVRPCLACNVGCIGSYMIGKNPSCAVNPAACRELNYGIEPLYKKKSIIVVGGGAAGMEAARTAKMRGHEVTLYEKTGELGGHLIPGSHHSFKTEMRELNYWYQRELSELGVPIKLNTALNADMIKSLSPDAVILATGSSPVVPNIPGINSENVLGAVDALKDGVEMGENVVVVGGGLTGCELALDLAMHGKKVTVVEAMDSILSAGSLVPFMNKQMLFDFIEYYNIDVLTGHMLSAINSEGAVVKGKDGTSATVQADNVIISIGFKPNKSMIPDLAETGIEVYQVGDANKVADVKTAIWQAYEVARSI